MNRKVKLMFLIAILALSGIGVAGARHMMTQTDQTQGDEGYYGHGYPMMRGWGQGGQMMMDPGYMMGPGMMGPGMMGPGMMGPGMMGPGMMGPGMMGPGMMGPGMFGPGMMAGMSEALNLTDDQQKKLDGIAEDSQAKMYDLMKEMRAERFRLQELYYADEPDTAAISKQMKKISDLQQKMFDLQLDARSRMQGVLTKEQAAEMKRWRHRWMMGG